MEDENKTYPTETNGENYTLGGSSDSGDPYMMNLWVRIIWDSLFIVIIVIAIVGNLMVLWIIAAHSQMWTIPNAFIANMSLSDLLMAVLNCIFNYIHMRDREWKFGSVYCTINNFMAIVTVAASVLNLTAMSIDRYKAIVWPLRVRTSKFVVFATIMFIWIGSTIFALPALLFSTTETTPFGHDVCFMKWPDGLMGNSYQDYIYNILILLVTYIFPILLIGICSFHMSIVLWCKQPVGVMTPQLRRVKMKKQKIVKMLIVLILIFGICWLPYHAYFIYANHNPNVMKMKYIQHIFLAFYWFAMTHSTVNPIVYYHMNPTFRRFYRHILTLGFLKRNQHDAPTGLILASALGLQVAAQITYGGSQSEYKGKSKGKFSSRKMLDDDAHNFDCVEQTEEDEHPVFDISNLSSVPEDQEVSAATKFQRPEDFGGRLGVPFFSGKNGGSSQRRSTSVVEALMQNQNALSNRRKSSINYIFQRSDLSQRSEFSSSSDFEQDNCQTTAL